jgi:hypothetical protein
MSGVPASIPPLLLPSPVIVWSLVIACGFCAAGYLVLRKEKTVPILDARSVLDHSIQVEAAGLVGQTEHQVFRFEEANRKWKRSRTGNH